MNELNRFSRAELELALSFVMPLDKAHEMVLLLETSSASHPDHLALQLSEDILDLLLLVSDSCADRAGSILELSAAQLQERRREAKLKFFLPG